MKQERDRKGHFSAKSDENRKVRSVRLTDTTWDTLSDLAQVQGLTIGISTTLMAKKEQNHNDYQYFLG